MMQISGDLLAHITGGAKSGGKTEILTALQKTKEAVDELARPKDTSSAMLPLMLMMKKR